MATRTATPRVTLAGLLHTVIPREARPGREDQIDREIVESSRCRCCGAARMEYIAYRSARSYYAVALCRDCGHAEAF